MATRKVGFLHNRSKRSFQVHFAAFVTRMYDFVEQEDVLIEERWAGDDTGTSLEDHAKYLVTKGVDVIVAAGGPQSATKAKTVRDDLKSTIPIVFTPVTDPLFFGLVDKLDKPGTNMTGIAGMTSELEVNRLQLLAELLGDNGKGKTIGVLRNKDRPTIPAQDKKLSDEATKLGVYLDDIRAAGLADIKAEFASLKTPYVAFLVTANSLFNDLRKILVTLIQNKPAIYQWREFAEAGGLMSFGPNIIEAYKKVGEYVGLILQGSSPEDLPVLFPDRFELVINLRVAQANGIDIPASLLSRAEIVRTHP